MRCLSMLFAVLVVVGSGGCDPYGTYNDPDETLGPIDPVLFPPANVGTGGDRRRPGRGRFSEIRAYVDETPLGYFSYAFPTNPAAADPLRVLEEGKPYAPVPAPPTFVFDGTGDSAFPAEDRYNCTPPSPGYSYDQQRDAVDFSQQGPVFSTLPVATYAEGALPTSRYVPVVAETGMGSSGLTCQRLKSAKRIEEVMGKTAATAATSKYLAWLIIDPAAPVFPRENPDGMGTMPPHPGVGLQRWGWYNRYLLAYLDGGYIPTGEDDGSRPQHRHADDDQGDPHAAAAPVRPAPDPDGDGGGPGAGGRGLRRARVQARHGGVLARCARSGTTAIRPCPPRWRSCPNGPTPS